MYKHFDGRFSVLTCTKDGFLLTETHLHVRMYTGSTCTLHIIML